MDLTPKLLTEGTDFQQVRRGYDPDEVDDFLERVAAAVSRLQGQLVEANRRAEIAESNAARAGGQGEAEGPVVEEMQRTLILAQRTADAAVREAREEADSLVAAARREAATVLTNGRQEADRYAAESRLSLATEVRELEERRETLLGDLGTLEQHVEAQRSRMRTSIEELQRVVDDPDAFRVEHPSGVEEPAPRAVEAPAEPMPEPEPQVQAQPEPRPQPEPAAEPLPAPPFPAEPEPVRAAEAAPVEVNAVPSEDRGFAPSTMRAPEPDVPRNVPTPFGPPPSREGGAVQTMASPPVAAAVESEPTPTPAPTPAPAPAQGNQLIDLTHEREMPAGQEEDAFLAELRKAMTDDEPLGPREDQPGVMRTIGEVPIGRQRGRFGRRR